MDKRVLFTGNGIPVINDIMSHLPNGYTAQSCHTDEHSLLEVLMGFKPHAVIASLSRETMETLKLYDILDTDPRYNTLPVIALGNEDDCAFFGTNLFRENMSILPRPINMVTFWETLERFTEMSAQKEPATAVAAPTPLVKDNLEEIAERQVEVAAQVAAKAPTHNIAFNRIHGRKTILVIDDDVRILNIVKLYLQELFDVVAVPSGKPALKYLSKHDVDLVLLDYMMPVEDGPTVLRQIRQESPCPNIPVLFLTGVADKELVMRGLEYHPEGYCLKPITQAELIERITAVLLDL